MISLAWILGGQCPPISESGGASAPPAPPVPPPMPSYISYIPLEMNEVYNSEYMNYGLYDSYCNLISISEIAVVVYCPLWVVGQ